MNVNKSKADYLKLRQDCERWLREGHGKQVARALSQLTLSKVPRSERLALTNLARRAGVPTLGLKLLTPGTRDEKGFLTDVSDTERAEYGILLQGIGSTTEALAILRAIDPAQVAEASLFLAFCHFSRWEYAEALPQLERYLQAPGISDYARVVGRINLASAHVFLGNELRAATLLVDLQAETRAHGYRRLLANSLELSAQLDLRAQKLTSAQEKLAEAARIFNEDGTDDSLYVDKWLSVAQSQASGDVGPLQAFRVRALARGHWESVRHADLHIARLEQDETLFRHLCFGTPHSGYRDEFLSNRDFAFKVPPMLRLESSAAVTGTPARSTLELATATLDGAELFKPGQKLHRLLLLLFADFYKPVRLGSAFAELFPDDHFNIFSSPTRVHQLVYRARKALEAARLPLTIGESPAGYRFELSAGLTVVIPRQFSVLGSEDVLVLRLREHFNEREFTAVEARSFLNLSLSTFNRGIQAACARALVEKIGAGARTRYRVSSRDISLRRAA
jgi:hypothetical protein